MSLRGSTAALALRPAIVAPSPAATERVLWLAAVDTCLSVGRADSDATHAAYRDLRRLVTRHAPSLYALTPVDAAASARWVVTVRESIGEADGPTRAAVLLRAAVAAWTDAPAGRWGALADAGAALAETLAMGDRVLRVADRLRGVMAGMWTTMGAGR